MKEGFKASEDGHTQYTAKEVCILKPWTTEETAD